MGVDFALTSGRAALDSGRSEATAKDVVASALSIAGGPSGFHSQDLPEQVGETVRQHPDDEDEHASQEEQPDFREVFRQVGLHEADQEGSDNGADH